MPGNSCGSDKHQFVLSSFEKLTIIREYRMDKGLHFTENPLAHD